MAVNISSLDIGLVATFLSGVGLFFRALRTYREYLRVQGKPGSPIGSITMGLVRVHGKPTSERLLDSPISHTPCCFYQVDIQKWRDDDDEQGGRWLHYGSEADGVRFYLKDSSGRVLVDARGAEIDLERSVVREIPSAQPLHVSASGACDAELLDYAVRVGPSAEAPGTHHDVETERAQLAIAKYLNDPTTPDQLFQGMVGPQVAQIQRSLEAQGPQSDPMREEIRLAQIELYKHPFWSPEYVEGFKRVTQLQEQHRMEQSQKRTSPPLVPPPSVDEVDVPVTGRKSDAVRYRFIERCILPDHEYDITGTCGPNPDAKDPKDHNLIRKGPNDPTYLISGLARQEVNLMLQMRAQLMIVGGGMLAVFCMGLLLLRSGLF